MRTIIAGGRDYFFKCADYSVLDANRDSITEVVSGACPTGVDSAGEAWARENGIPVKRFPADWTTHGKAAGPIRNRAMAEYASGGQAILFHGGRGTESMRREAVAHGLKVLIAPNSNT